MQENLNNYPKSLMYGCELKQTCFSCPEQYAVFYEDTQIGYLRLRHGIFTAVYPEVSGRVVYTASPKGEGEFEDSERYYYLNFACYALRKAHKKSLDSSTED